MATVEAQIGRRLPRGWDREYAPLYEAAYDAELRAVDGVAEVLDRLHGWGVQTCVASNGSHAKLARNLGRAGLAARLRGRVFSAEDVAAGKPAPDLFLHAAASMGATPGGTVVVEDSPPRCGRGPRRRDALSGLCRADALLPAERPRWRALRDHDRGARPSRCHRSTS